MNSRLRRFEDILKSRDQSDILTIHVQLTFFLVSDNLATLQTCFIKCLYQCTQFAVAGFVITKFKDYLNQVCDLPPAARKKLTDPTSKFAKDYLQLLVSEIVLTEREVRFKGKYGALVEAVKFAKKN